MINATDASLDRPRVHANALPPNQMKPADRRAELCRLLALGLVRLKLRQSSELSDGTGESSLHKPPDRSGHATTKVETDA
jgi:hypothetical protein